jgi:signal transduction histidine kinase
MKTILLNLIFLSCVVSALPQTPDRDSLWAKLSKAKDDTQKVALLNELADFFNNDISPDSSFLIGQAAFKLSDSIGYKKGVVKSQITIANASQAMGDFETAVKMGYSILEYATKYHDSSVLAGALACLSIGYRGAGDYKEALKWTLQNIDFSRQFDNCEYCPVLLASVGVCYFGMEKYDSALLYVQRALQYPDPWGFGWICLKMGKIQEKLNNTNAAFRYYHQSIDDLLKFKNSKDLAGAYNGMAALFLKIGQTDSCIQYATAALEFAQQRKYNEELIEASSILASAYENRNPAQALIYYKEAANAKDSLFSIEKQRKLNTYKFNEELKLAELRTTALQIKSKNRMIIFGAITVLFSVVGVILIRNNRQKRRANLKLSKAYSNLKSTQAQLIQSEKMASLGELTAGIAHEIQNPLNFVNNFSDVNNELLSEMKDEMDKGNIEDAKSIANDIIGNEEKINYHGKRADAIVKGMLQHSRTSSGQKELSDINALVDEYLRLAYHGLRAKDKLFDAKVETDFDPSAGKINIVPQEIGRVILNLINNAFYAVNEKTKLQAASYTPQVLASTKRVGNNILISVADNGNGIPKGIIEKIFQPFFTTKPTGQGTGLGLSLAYDIVKAHGGEIEVETKDNEGSEFIILLPVKD